MKGALLLIAVIVALAAAAASVGAESPIVAKALGSGALKTPMTLKVKPGAMVVESITVNPGGNFGWHTHGSPVAVVVTGGTLTVLDPTIANCKPFTVSKGQAFIEPANHLHLARNDSAKPVTVYATTYLVVPKDAEASPQAATDLAKLAHHAERRQARAAGPPSSSRRSTVSERCRPPCA